MKNNHFVYPAEPHREGEMGSFGNASCMLLRQFQFPNEYTNDDKLMSADHDRCMSWDFNHSRECFKKHTGTGELGLQDWLRRASNEQVLDFLRDILKVDDSIKWTGYRIMGTVNRGNGYPVWTLQLFAKHPNSKIKVYSDASAPNILPRPRY